MNTGRISFDKARFVSECYYKALPEIRKAKEGDLLFTVTGSYGIVIPVNTNRKFCFQRHIGLIKTITSSSWIRFVLQSNYVQSYCDSIATGTAQKTVSLGHLRNLIIPIPPEKEQVRIINELELWLNKVEIIQRNECDLKRLLSFAKSIILDLSIHGNLVPQDPADEPAADLLKRVNPNAVVSTDTSHYALPTSWAWVKGKDLLLPMKSTRPTGHTFKYIDIDSIDNVNQCVSAIKVLPSDQAPSRASRFTEKNNILFSMVRPYLRNIAIVTEEGCIASTGFYVCRQRECLDHKYLYYLMTSKYVVDGLNSFMKGDNSPSINKGNVDEYVFPLPPLNEQKRIAAKVDELFAVIDQIQQSLE